MIQDDPKRGMYKTALELFLGEVVTDVETDVDDIKFETYSGFSGTLCQNAVGNWDIWIGEEVIYEIESEVFLLVEHNNDKELFELYEYVKELDINLLKHKSKLFVNIIQKSIQKLLLSCTLPIEGRTVIDSTEVIYTDKRKFLLCLN